MEWPTLLGLVVFAGMVLTFMIFGSRMGWRVAGVVMLVGALRSLREGRVGVGIQGYEPSFYLTGKVAVTVSILGILLSLLLLLYPYAFMRES
jgi:hypothetical protein